MSLLKIFNLGKQSSRVEDHQRAIALGKFDALHLAHLEMIKETVSFAREHKLVPAVTSFSRGFSSNDCLSINTFQEKQTVLATLGIQEIIYFNALELAELDYLAYLEEIIKKKLKAKFLTFGENHLFGKDRTGNCQSLIDWCQTNKIDYKKQILKKSEDYFPISSSRIKKLLALGKIKSVNNLLPNGFYLSGKIQTGIQEARKLGTPTLNFIYPKGKTKVRKGVYCVYAQLLDKIGQKEHQAIVNIGRAPTIKKSNQVLVEVHLLGLNQSQQSRELVVKKESLIKIRLLKFLRAERKFPTKQFLIKQIRQDLFRANRFFSTTKKYEI